MNTSLSKILSANVISSPFDAERFSLDWTQVKIGEIVYVQDTGRFYVVKDLEELDNEAGYDQFGADGTVTEVSVVANNGITAVVTNPNNTPQITLGLGAITPTTVNGLTITPTTGVLTIANGKTLAVNNSITFTGTDGTTMTLPGTSGTLAALGGTNTWSGVNTFSNSTASTTTTDGAVIISGGVGIAKNLYVGGSTLNLQPGSGVAGSIGVFTTGAVDSRVIVSGAAGQNRALTFRTAGTQRWEFAANATAEGGSNAGSNINLNAYSDAGSFIDGPLTIIRAAGGATTFNRTTASTSTTTGTVVVAGGIGVAGDSFFGGTNTFNAARPGDGSSKVIIGAAATNSEGSIGFYNGASVNGSIGYTRGSTTDFRIASAGGGGTFTLSVAGSTQLTVTSTSSTFAVTTDSISTSTGSIITAGGLGVAKNIYGAGKLSISRTYTAAAGYEVDHLINSTVTADAGGTSTIVGTSISTTVSGANSPAELQAVLFTATNQGSAGSTPFQYGMIVHNRITGAANTGSLQGIQIYPELTSTGNITGSYRALRIFTPTVSSTGDITGSIEGILISNQGRASSTGVTGVNVADQTKPTSGSAYGYRGQVAAGTGKWNLYMDGTAANLLAGVTSITDTTDSTSKTSGSLILSGGLGVAKPIYADFSVGTYAAGQREFNWFKTTGIADAGGTTDIIPVRIAGTITGGNAAGRILSVFAAASHQGSATLTNLSVFSAGLQTDGTGNVTNATGYTTYIPFTSTGSITGTLVHYQAASASKTSTGVITGSIVGFRVSDQGLLGGHAEIAGVFVLDQTKGSQNVYGVRSQIAAGAGGKWNGYFDGTAPNHATGPWLLGTTTNTSGRLQFVSGTTAADGILFGTDSTTLYRSASNTLKTDGAFVTAVSVTTGAPTTGTAGAWKLGIPVTGVTTTFVTTSYIQLDVNGTLYKLGLVTSVP